MLLKKKLLVSISAFFLATTFIALCLPNNVFAASLSESKKLYNAVVKKIEKIELKIEKLDSQITDTMSDIEETNKKIDVSKNNIEKTEGEIKNIQAEITEEQIVFGERMEALYVNGSTSYVDVLFESESFTDFISRIDTVKTIIGYDKEIMSNLDNQKTNLASKKESLEKEQETLVALQKEGSEKLNTLNDKKKEQDTLIATLKSERNTYASEIKTYEAEIARTLEASKKAQEEQNKTKSSSTNESTKKENNSSVETKANNASSSTPKGSNIVVPGSDSSSNSNNSKSPSKPDKAETPNRGDNASTGSSSTSGVVSYARKFLGTPYVWGGSTPSGFDCSGFTSYVFRNAAGISLPRTSAAQAGVGSTVTRANLQPGDLVFFGGSTINHVGIYTGNGNYIHSPRTGDVVKEVPMNRSDFKFGKRI